MVINLFYSTLNGKLLNLKAIEIHKYFQTHIYVRFWQVQQFFFQNSFSNSP